MSLRMSLRMSLGMSLRKKRVNPLEIQILNMIKKDNKISTEKMAMTLGISSKTVKRHIKDIVQ